MTLHVLFKRTFLLDLSFGNSAFFGVVSMHDRLTHCLTASQRLINVFFILSDAANLDLVSGAESKFFLRQRLGSAGRQKVFWIEHSFSSDGRLGHLEAA